MINGIDFKELETERYWSFPKSYKKDSKTETKNMIFSGDYIGARKMDGAYYRFIKEDDGTMTLQGRSRGVSGNFLNKIGHVPHLMSFFESLPNGTCLLGELYFPNNEGSHNVTTIMGCKEDKAIARQKAGDKLHYYVFDVWAYNGESYLTKNMMYRISTLEIIKNKCMEYEMINHQNSVIEFAEYWDGKELWDNLQKILLSGGEGIVMTKKDSHPEPGKRPARKTLKVKKEIANTIDCIFTGHFTAPSKEYEGKEIETWKYWEDMKTGEKIEGAFAKEFFNGKSIIPVTKPYFFGWAGSLEIGLVKENKVIPIGYLSGLTDDIKSRPLDFKGKVIEISCMEILPTGGLRHAKFIQFRDDLTIKDASWEKVFG